MRIFTYTKFDIFFALPFIVALFSGFASLDAQDYKRFYSEVNKGFSLHEQGNYSEALMRYESASQMVDFVQTPFLQKFLKAAKKAKNKTLEENYKRLIETQRKTPAEYAHLGPKLDSLLAEDQRVRKRKQRLIKYYWKNVDNTSVWHSPKFLKAKNAQEEWSRTDSLNIQILLSMFETYGFLDERKIGEERYAAVFVLLLHFDKDTSNTVLQPILDRALAKGQITPVSYALILDRHLNSCNLPQKFYSWPMLRSDPKLSEEDINQISDLRADIGIYENEIIINEARGFWSVSYKRTTPNG